MLLQTKHSSVLSPTHPHPAVAPAGQGSNHLYLSALLAAGDLRFKEFAPAEELNKQTQNLFLLTF